MKTSFIPADYQAPKAYDHPQFSLRVLSPPYAELDYQTVMANREQLQGIFGPASDWPRADLTLAKNREDMAMHQGEFERGEAFAFTVLNPALDECLGCIYIDPPKQTEHDCEIQLWVSQTARELEPILIETLTQWLQQDWPLKRVYFPQYA